MNIVQEKKILAIGQKITYYERMNGRITTKQVAAQTGKTVNRIQQMCVRGEITEPLAKKIGSNWWLLPRAVDFIRAIPERRGRPRKYKALEKVAVS